MFLWSLTNLHIPLVHTPLPFLKLFPFSSLSTRSNRSVSLKDLQQIQNPHSVNTCVALVCVCVYVCYFSEI